MSWEFGVIITETPNPEGGFSELPRTETDDFAGTWIDWDHSIIGYSGWNIAAAREIGEQTEGANYELLTQLGNQSYVRLSERTKQLDRFEERLPDIASEALRARCSALVTGCREALRLDPDKAVLLVF